jgi:hypothetical protein
MPSAWTCLHLPLAGPGQYPGERPGGFRLVGAFRPARSSSGKASAAGDLQAQGYASAHDRAAETTRGAVGIPSGPCDRVGAAGSRPGTSPCIPERLLAESRPGAVQGIRWGRATTKFALLEVRQGKITTSGVLPRLTSRPGILRGSTPCLMSEVLPWYFSQFYLL